MAATYLTYVTREQDRWDLIAHRLYGDATAFRPLLEANPDHAPLPELPAGLRLLVPLPVEEPASVAGLPPWKR